LALPIQDTKIQNGSSYDHTDHCLNSSIVVRCLDYLQPNEIQPGEFSEANANTDAYPNGSAENSPGVRPNSGETIANATAKSNASGGSTKSDPHAGADRGETNAYACAASRR